MNETEIGALRARFPVLGGTEDSPPPVYLDSAASAPTPDCVAEAVAEYYRHFSCNIHRGLYELSSRATERYERSRKRIADFIGAAPEEIVYTRGATEAINLVAHSWGTPLLGPGDTIVISELEHHANLVPWQQLALRTGAELRYLPVDEESGLLLGREIARNIDSSVRLVAVSGMSNATGVLPPLQELRDAARRVGARFLIDAAQYVVHHPIDVVALDPDFLVFSFHKLYGPTGLGVLFGRSSLLEEMPPYLTGGDMIVRVRKESSDFKDPPQRFEAGTPHIAGVFGAEAAIDFVEELGLEAIRAREQELGAYMRGRLAEIPGLKLYGPPAGEAGPVCSFNVEGVHPHDTGTILAEQNIAVRAGFHCAQPYLERLGASGGTVRASLGFYNTREEIDHLVKGIGEVRRIFDR